MDGWMDGSRWFTREQDKMTVRCEFINQTVHDKTKNSLRCVKLACVELRYVRTPSVATRYRKNFGDPRDGSCPDRYCRIICIEL